MVTVQGLTGVYGNRFKFVGLSSDEKPTMWGTETVKNGCTFLETDTSANYIFDGANSEWTKLSSSSSSSGSSGSSDYNIATDEEVLEMLELAF